MESDETLFEAPQLLGQLAIESLARAAGGDHVATGNLLERIFLGYGNQGLYFTYCTWADQILDAMRAELQPGSNTRRLAQRSFIETCITFAQWVNPPAAWAGRYVLARADWEEMRLRELFAELMACTAEDANRRILALVDLAIAAAAMGKAEQR